MTASVDFLSILVTLALIVTVISPLVLLALLVRDAKRKQLW